MLRVIDEINTLAPTNVAWPSKKFGGDGSRDDACCSGEQVTFFHDGWSLNAQNSQIERGGVTDGFAVCCAEGLRPSGQPLSRFGLRRSETFIAHTFARILH